MKAILFDIDDTLYDQIQPFRAAYEAVFGERFKIDLYELFEARHRRSDEVFEKSLNGEMTMRDMYIYRVKMAMADLGCEIEDGEALRFQEFYAKGQEQICVPEALKKLLACLNADPEVVSGVITNGPSEHQWKKVRTLGLEQWILPEYIFISGDCGAIKPDRAIFDLARERIAGGRRPDCIGGPLCSGPEALPGADVQEFYYVGDSWRNDIVGAKEAGWQAVWLNRRRVDTPAGAVQADYTVYGEEELYQCIMHILQK